MLIWINGAFGGGKTQTAHELRRRLPGSLVCDPEEVGIGLRRMMPASLRGDFQDLTAWRQGVHEVLDLVLHKHEGPVIAPMTLVEPVYFDEIVGRLRDAGHDVRHFALLADRQTVLRRLRGRGLGIFREDFAVSKVDLCLDRLRHPEFAEHLWTDHLSVAQVAERIAESVGVALEPNRDVAVLAGLRRSWTALKQIRLG
ncbi:AAA domain-containing protein [Saccharopolyspora erythraea NRRL 2338]|uniref:TmrB-like protein n=2 Tax=Saccharopolyspora erythraea TaxID=1836 RepID=A4FLB5_SACEN|nr:AAA family ATPase [Saccharopolyspora erythraea]EQD83799.1 TmrB [Saccharopolyspora erythraea D]PFG98479.1 AAA domain-containing protein [Saccharopolyspora erythraea NRRL 2338]QRK88538.1 AAA family ATPase [Saccharopolyspora erythraea]CAM04840.1 TmrB-like protein [Saccharopolyspora erythraea NRRL 2338]